jgi:hypothetical protein
VQIGTRLTRETPSYSAPMSVEAKLIARLDELIEKADQVLATHRPNPSNVLGFPTLSTAAFTEWQTQSLSFLLNLLGEDHRRRAT